MRTLVLFTTVPLLMMVMAGQNEDSPHGKDLTISCSVCHSPNSWDLDRKIYSFDHNTTQLPLVGQHSSINCKLCHPTLIFTDAETDCYNCHTDMHEQSVGMDCARCHTPASWIVENITDVHRQSRFPLQGPHLLANCLDCHPSASLLHFEPAGVECIDCHIQDYQSAANPNHILGNFSTECINCHTMYAFTWTGSGYNHDFFPLTQGHSISDCSRCHNVGDYSNISAECFSCHENDYNSTTNPSHITATLSTDCLECHSTAPGWKPADFRIHDAQYFPIYSGSHRNEWDNCTECHSNPGNYAVFSCIDCHEHSQTRMDNKHSDENGYEYNSMACLECHPTGRAED
jgi:hypothetical protein